MRQDLDAFLAAFVAGARHVPRARPARREVAELFGVEPAPALARLVDVLGEHERHERVDDFGWFGGQGGWTVDWLPRADENALEHALSQPFRAGVLVDALPLGCDHGGNIYLADVASGEIVLLDHDTGALPATRSSLADRWRAADDLLAVLAGYTDDLPAPADGRGATTDLLRLWLRGESAALTQLLSTHATHPARLVRDTVAKLHATRAGSCLEEESADYHIGFALQALGRHEAALSRFEPAPAHAHVYLAMTRSFAQLERWDEMHAAAVEAVELAPDLADAHLQLGVASTALGDLPGVIDACRRALALAPDNALALFHLGRALVLTGDAGGEAYLERATARDPRLTRD